MIQQDKPVHIRGVTKAWALNSAIVSAHSCTNCTIYTTTKADDLVHRRLGAEPKMQVPLVCTSPSLSGLEHQVAITFAKLPILRTHVGED